MIYRFFGHPVVGASWEGFVIENLLSVLPWSVKPFFYRTFAGAEIDLVLELSDGERWAIEIKRSLSAKPEKGFIMLVKTSNQAEPLWSIQVMSNIRLARILRPSDLRD